VHFLTVYKVNSMIFPLPFSGTRSRISLCPSWKPGRKICSRIFALGNMIPAVCSWNFGKTKSCIFISLVSSYLFVFLSIHISFLLLAFTAATKPYQHKVENKTYSLSFSLSSVCFCLFLCLSFHYLQIILPLCQRLILCFVSVCTIFC
jgi:hypothetical protein